MESAKKGVIAIAVAKIVFIVTSYGLNIVLMAKLGRENFGLWRTAFLFLSLLNNVVVVATIESTSRFTSAKTLPARSLLKHILSYQMLIGIGGAVVMLLASLFFARDQQDDTLSALILVGGIPVFAYALYAACVGSLNGRQLFTSQALLDMGFSILRTAGILIGVVIAGTVVGAMWGFALAAVSVLAAGILVAMRAKQVAGPQALAQSPKERMFGMGTWFAFLLPLGAFHVARNVTMLVDLQILKRMVATSGHEMALSLSRELAGDYGAAQLFAFIPFQLLTALTFVIFPLIAKATAANDNAKASQLLKNATRFALIAVFAIAAPISGAARGIVRLGNADFIEGGVALEILAIGMAAFALFTVFSTALNSAGHARTSLIVAALGALAVIGLNLTFLSFTDVANNVRTLRGVALGTSCGTTLAAFLSFVAVRKEFGAFFPLLSAARVFLASVGAFCAAHFTPQGDRVMAIVAAAAGGIVFVVMLLILGELKRADLNLLLKKG